VIERTTSIKIAHQDIVPRCSAAHRDGTSRAVARSGPYLAQAAGRSLWNAAKVLLFVDNTLGCGTELRRHATLKNLLRQLVPSPRLHPMEL
jgi:hypothetical protein